ncbi:MAG: hypothetical protein K8J08_06595 [Thermoanaerobaculia bacterium]|nr:hypothetical protein [Thermoanaerobaculia bacterium]
MHDDHNYYTRVLPPFSTDTPAGAPCSTIDVTYTGFSAPAQTAFQYAVDLWEQFVCSSVTIRVSATFAALPPNVIGSAGANLIHRDEVGLVSGTWYGGALADALTGVDQQPDNPTSMPPSVTLSASTSEPMPTREPDRSTS